MRAIITLYAFPTENQEIKLHNQTSELLFLWSPMLPSETDSSAGQGVPVQRLARGARRA